MIRILQISAVLAVSLMVSTPALADPPAHAPAHGYRAKHHYIYYPQKQIYYAPETQQWFWFDGGSWSFGLSLPVAYQQYARGGYNVYLDVDRPYEAQQDVTAGYRRHEWTPYHYGNDDDSDRRGGDQRHPHGHKGK